MQPGGQQPHQGQYMHTCALGSVYNHPIGLAAMFPTLGQSHIFYSGALGQHQV